jgi:uncharacterized DUF497 family protein
MLQVKTIEEPISFEWDEGNSQKSWIKHKITAGQAQQVFFDMKKIVYKDAPHSRGEERYIVLGKTEAAEVLFVVYTLRGKHVRIISARRANRKEVLLYEKENNVAKI